MSKNYTSGKKKSDKPDLLYPILLVIGLISLFIWFIVSSTNYETTSEAVVEGKLLSVTTRISGYTNHVYVQETQEVKKGDLLLEIDSSYYEAHLRKLESDLKIAKTKLFLKEREEQENNPGIKNPFFSFAKHKFSSYENMYEEVQPQTKTEEEKRACLTSKETVPEVKPKQEKQAEGDTKTEEEKEETIEELTEEIKRLESDIEQAKLDLSYTKVHAPQDGTISVITVKEGEYVETGQNIISIIPKRVWIFAKFKEEQTAYMREGQPVIVKVGKYPTRRFKGVVDTIQRHEVNTGQKVPVKIMFTEDYSEYDITPGTTVTVKVELDKYSR